MEVIIEHRELADRHAEDFRKFAEPVLDPELAVVLSLAQ
jgi:hypothetical protein